MIDTEQAHQLIAEYYFQKYLDFLKKFVSTPDLVKTAADRAVEEIHKLGIMKVYTEHDESTNKTKITIELCRPGLLIGKQGTNIEALQSFTNCDIHIVETDSVGWRIAGRVYDVAGIFDY